MSHAPRYETDYSRYVNSNLTRMLRERGGVHNMNACAEMVGLKPTQHFRKRVRQMLAAGLIDSQTCFTPSGGLEMCFSYRDPVTLKEIPF